MSPEAAPAASSPPTSHDAVGEEPYPARSVGRTAPDALRELRDGVRAGALNLPGIYRMVGRGNVVIYVGKSKRVRTRLMGYFRARDGDKAWRIVRDAIRIEWEYVPSEFASLLREIQLIKRHRPHYNVRHKRSLLYSFLKLTGGSAPRLQVVRRVTDEPGTYYGPFRGGQRIVEAVRELNDVLQLRDCRATTPIRYADQDDLFGHDSSPLCPRHELRLCMAPCAGRCSAAEYGRRVQLARDFLRGDVDEPIRRLESRMEEAAARWEFEHAASLRNRIGRLEMLKEEFLRLRESIETLSFLYAVPGFDGDHRIYAIRSGSVRQQWPAPRSPAERRVLIEKAEEHFRQPEPVSEIGTPHRVDELLLVSHWFRIRPDELSRTFSPGQWRGVPLHQQLERVAPVLPRSRGRNGGDRSLAAAALSGIPSAEGAPGISVAPGNARTLRLPVMLPDL